MNYWHNCDKDNLYNNKILHLSITYSLATKTQKIRNGCA